MKVQMHRRPIDTANETPQAKRQRQLGDPAGLLRRVQEETNGDEDGMKCFYGANESGACKREPPFDSFKSGR